MERVSETTPLVGTSDLHGAAQPQREEFEARVRQAVLSAFELVQQASQSQIATIRFENGGIYTGGTSEGVPHCSGELICQNGRRVKGSWNHGKMEGHCIDLMTGGASFKGFYYQGLRHGQGVLRNEQGRVWEGTWKNGKMDGIFKIIDGAKTYFGLVNEKGLPQGQGKLTEDEDWWEGEFNNGAIWNGRYFLRFRSGQGEIGRFIDGRKSPDCCTLL